MARSKNLYLVMPSSGRIWHENIFKGEGEISALQMQFHQTKNMIK